MGSGVATVGRRKYAVGLYWQPSPSGRVAQAAKEAARQPGQHADFFAVRPGVKGGRVAQFGLGLQQSGHKLGMATLAASLANRLPGSWAGAFKLSEGIVVIVVRDDLIAPDGDQIYLDDASARDRLIQEVTLGGLQRIYAPEAWSIPASETVALPFVLQNRGDCPLQPVKIPRAILIGVAVTALVVVLGIAGFWYYQYQEEKAQEAQRELIRIEAQKRAIEMKAAGLGGPIQIAYPPPKRFWEDEPHPLELIEACRVALDKVPQARLGWNLSTLSCAKGGLSLSWTRIVGYTQPLADASIDPSGSNASRGVPIEGLKNRGPQDLIDPAEITKRYLAQNWNGTISRLPDDPPPPKPENVRPEDWNPPPTPWIKRGFTLKVTDLPGELPQYFGGVPGVIINSIVSQSGSWQISGVIYENRK
ncbi:MAG: type 4b pilus protein PilO2 [Alphaproteobacteria bacterium]